MNDTTSRISGILEQVRLLKSKYDELAAVTGEQFNVFSILGVETDEVRTHSAFLTDLLDPQGSHRQGGAFLKLFLGLDALKSSKSEEYRNPDTFQVSKEASTAQGQIDILLESKDACIVIENKIYAQDQISQLNRYYQYAKKKFSHDKQIKLIYLTLDGSLPDEKSLKAVNGQGRHLRKDEVVCLSYSEDIIKWLEDCMKLQEVQRVSPIREIVFQYRDLLKQLTGQLTNKRLSVELKDILVKDENHKLIPELEEMILAFKVHLQYKFWEELKKQILELPKVSWHKAQYESHDPSSEDDIRNFYTWKTHRYLCQIFHLGAWNQYEAALETGVEYATYAELDKIYFGFILFENETRVDDCQDVFERLANQIGSGFKIEKNSIWKYSKSEIGFPVKYPNSVVGDLLNDDKRKEIVKELVTEIAEAVTQLKKT
ncbi:MAG: PD-(D/E)XK nuclease family protein [Gammaproteobacteria bacterium]|nr:PD-(D/E)XK nuclease family protein [Gammaproteobacteria bacterium]MCY4313320.1 PD-(D/E)XK nuclease family protein [Gammaproteobacteria bacterium]